MITSCYYLANSTINDTQLITDVHSVTNTAKTHIGRVTFFKLKMPADRNIIENYY